MYVYMAWQWNKRKKWIILNKNQNENQATIYLNYKDYKDKYPNEPEVAERYAHYDALTSEKYPNDKINNILQQIIEQTIEKRHLVIWHKMDAKILIWNVDSIRDFTIKSFFIQILYENSIDIAMLQETMLTKEDKFFIKGYRIYRANAKSRKGVEIIVSNQIDCDSYKLI